MENDDDFTPYEPPSQSDTAGADSGKTGEQKTITDEEIRQLAEQERVPYDVAIEQFHDAGYVILASSPNEDQVEAQPEETPA